MIRTKTILLALSALALAHAASAVISISLTASNSSRTLDYFSGAYAEVGLDPNGMYSIADDSPFGSVTVFPNGADWSQVGTFTLDGTPTGIGFESFTITDATFDFQTYVDGDSTFVTGPYTTDITAISVGTIELTNGVVTLLDFQSTVAFTFIAAPGLPYIGDLDIGLSTFDLFVDDDSIDFGFGPVRNVWDADGSSAATLIPEPSTYASIFAVLIFAFAISRRRKA